MGTDTSLLQPGYLRVTDQTLWNSGDWDANDWDENDWNVVQDYGWLDTSDLTAVDQGSGSNIHRDYILISPSATFRQVLPNGDYSVLLLFRDNTTPRDIDITINGVFQATVNVP